MMWFLEIHEAQGNLSARYTYAPGYIDAVAVQERDLNADGDFGDDDEVVYYHTNTLFSVYALTDATENVVERYRYDAYGAATVLDSDWSADADGISDVASLGRFVSRDAAGYEAWFDLYCYVVDRPTAAGDALGMSPHWGTGDFLWHYFHGQGEAVDLMQIGLFGLWRSDVSKYFKAPETYAFFQVVDRLSCEKPWIFWQGTFDFTTYPTASLEWSLTNVLNPLFSVGQSHIRAWIACTGKAVCECCKGEYVVTEYRASCNFMYVMDDWFRDPVDLGIELPGGTPYPITATWTEERQLVKEIPCD